MKASDVRFPPSTCAYSAADFATAAAAVTAALPPDAVVAATAAAVEEVHSPVFADGNLAIRRDANWGQQGAIGAAHTADKHTASRAADNLMLQCNASRKGHVCSPSTQRGLLWCAAAGNSHG